MKNKKKIAATAKKAALAMGAIAVIAGCTAALLGCPGNGPSTNIPNVYGIQVTGITPEAYIQLVKDGFDNVATRFGGSETKKNWAIANIKEVRIIATGGTTEVVSEGGKWILEVAEDTPNIGAIGGAILDWVDIESGIVMQFDTSKETIRLAFNTINGQRMIGHAVVSVTEFA